MTRLSRVIAPLNARSTTMKKHIDRSMYVVVYALAALVLAGLVAIGTIVWIGAM